MFYQHRQIWCYTSVIAIKYVKQYIFFKYNNYLKSKLYCINLTKKLLIQKTSVNVTTQITSFKQQKRKKTKITKIKLLP